MINTTPAYRFGKNWKELSALFGHPIDKHLQDWPIEVADPERLEEYIQAYGTTVMNEDSKFSLMEMILAALVNQKTFELQKASWPAVRELLKTDFKLNEYQIYGYCGWEEKNLEHSWETTPLFREFWLEQIMPSDDARPPRRIEIEYDLGEEDFLAFQLFQASQSPKIQQKRRKSRILLSIASFILAGIFYLEEVNSMAGYFAVVGLITTLFYPRYAKWRYRRHYQSHIREHYAGRFDEKIQVEIGEKAIFSKDKTGEGSINLSEVEYVDETSQHFFLKISSGQGWIIPKAHIPEPEVLKAIFQKSGLKVNDWNNWYWK